MMEIIAPASNVNTIIPTNTASLHYVMQEATCSPSTDMSDKPDSISPTRICATGSPDYANQGQTTPSPHTTSPLMTHVSSLPATPNSEHDQPIDFIEPDKQLSPSHFVDPPNPQPVITTVSEVNSNPKRDTSPLSNPTADSQTTKTTTSSSLPRTTTPCGSELPNAPVWTQVLQQFASFCQDNAKSTTAPPNFPVTGGAHVEASVSSPNKPTVDPMAMFQAMLANMGQAVSNSNMSSQNQFNESVSNLNFMERSMKHNSSPMEKSPQPDHNPLTTSLPMFPHAPLGSNGMHPNHIAAAAHLKHQGTMDQLQSNQSPLALTASILALMTGAPKPNPQVSPDPMSMMQPFMMAARQLQQTNPTQNVHPQPDANSQFNPGMIPSSLFPVVTTSAPTMPIPEPMDPLKLPSGMTLPENRDLLYQLGQRLMAMAGAPTPTSRACSPKQSPVWTSVPNPIHPISSNYNMTSNCNNTQNSGTTACNPAQFLHNPMAAFMNSALFSAPYSCVSQQSHLHSVSNAAPQFGVSTSVSNALPTIVPHTGAYPNVPLGGRGEKKCAGPDQLSPNALTKLGLDKALAHLSTSMCATNATVTSAATPTGLSGISMRGNQKYSAYYQHQRKQGFPTGMANDYAATVGTRRPGTSVGTNGPQMSNPSRCGNRRFRNSNTPLGSPTGLNTFGVDSRATGPANQRATSALRGHMTPMGPTAFPTFRPTVYKPHNMNSSNLDTNPGQSKSHIPGDLMLSGSHSVTTSHSNTPIISDPVTAPTRLRDTAFLCSCGKDFEGLYHFTVHMKDTGHKPKSDHSERDIPKLVRGQDMWINSETEQTREILRCMRCHQSFRNLPELTMHMMKTNHYSEIVYNDSGRLVFVNPDEHRRGATTTTPIPTSMHSSTSKSSASLSRDGANKRTSRAMANHNISGSSPNGKQSPSHGERAAGSKEISEISEIAISNPSSATASVTTESPEADRCKRLKLDTPDRRTPTPTGESSYITSNSRPGSVEKIKMDSPRTERSPKLEHQNQIPYLADSSSDRSTSEGGFNALRKMESFIENTLPKVSPRGLTVKVDRSGSSTPHPFPTSPASGVTVDSNPGVYSQSDEKVVSEHRSSIASRKRTHSGTSSPSRTSSPSLDPHQSPGSGVLSVSSSPAAKVSSTSEGGMGQNHTARAENPLSSLQKLVETTHKPSPSSAVTFSGPNSTALFVSCGSALSTGLKASPLTTTRCSTGISGQPSGSVRGQYSPGEKTPGSVSSSGSGPSTFSQPLVSPVHSDSVVPALSALYAYVEKSSPCPVSESNRTTPISRSDRVSPPTQLQQTNVPAMSTVDPTQSPSTPLNQLLMNPAMQTFYTAAMSSLATQYLNTPANDTSRSPVTQPNPTPHHDDPMHFFKQLAVNFKDALDFSNPTASAPSPDMTAGWLRMMQALMNPNQSQAPSETNQSSSSSDHGETKRPHTPRSSPQSTSRLGFEAMDTETSMDHVNASPVHPKAGTPFSVSSSMGQPQSISAQVCMNGGIARNCGPGVLTNARYQPPPLSGRPMNNTPGPSNHLLSTMITKKAKCHFCGKPFANKGQVRLHISKNKCPCLLQQSCHVAALAAAFGADNRGMANSSYTPGTNKAPSSSSLYTRSAKEMNIPSFPQLQPTGGASNDDTELPSALSLLRERFQNFDPTQPSSHGSMNKTDGPVDCPTGNNNNNNNAIPFHSMLNRAMPDGMDCPTGVNMPPFSSLGPAIESWFGAPGNAPMIPNTKDTGGLSAPGGPAANPVTAAAANASHLAAMALLAQTLVQLSSSTNASNEALATNCNNNNNNSTTNGNFVSNAMSSLSSSSSNTTNNNNTNINGPPSQALSNSAIQNGPGNHNNNNLCALPFMNPNTFNLELLMNQANIAKQLVALNWSNQSLGVGSTNPSESTSPMSGSYATK